MEIRDLVMELAGYRGWVSLFCHSEDLYFVPRAFLVDANKAEQAATRPQASKVGTVLKFQDAALDLG